MFGLIEKYDTNSSESERRLCTCTIVLSWFSTWRNEYHVSAQEKNLSSKRRSYEDAKKIEDAQEIIERIGRCTDNEVVE